MTHLDIVSILAMKVLKFATVAAASTMIIAGSYTAWDMYHTEKAAFSSYDLAQYRPQVENGEPATLEEVEKINPDSKAWITIYDTHIDYPATQGKDDLEYVNKDIYGKTTPTGSIYLAAQNNGSFADDYTLMYGHHMDNGAMFGDVSKYMDASYFNSHTKGILITDDNVYDLELIGALETYAYDEVVYSPKRTGLGIVDYLRANAINTRSLGNVSKVLGLSTCDYGRTNGRDVVFFKMSVHDGDLPYEDYIEDSRTPLIGHLGADYWALLNLICMIVTVYNFIPLHLLFSKYRRKAAMEDRNSLAGESEDDEDGLFDTEKFGRKTRIGTIAEMVIAAASVIAFFLTEDMRLPVVFIDKWTPLMLLLLLLCWIADVKLLRLGDDTEDEDEEDDEDAEEDDE